MGLKFENLTKKYLKRETALDNVSLEFAPNTIYGLLGRNGAGKSTMLNIVFKRINATSGEVSLDGKKVWTNQDAMSKLFLTSEETWVPIDWKVEKYFKFLDQMYDGFDWLLAENFVKAFDIKTNKKLKALSTGYRSIAKLIAGLCVNADYVFFDEPVLGLDANHRHLFNQKLLMAFESRPRTFVISTHIIEEVAPLLNEVIIIDKGKIKQIAKVEELVSLGHTISGPAEEVIALTTGMNVVSQQQFGNILQSVVMGSINKEIPSTVQVSQLNLQEYFVYLTKREGES